MHIKHEYPRLFCRARKIAASVTSLHVFLSGGCREGCNTPKVALLPVRLLLDDRTGLELKKEDPRLVGGRQCRGNWMGFETVYGWDSVIITWGTELYVERISLGRLWIIQHASFHWISFYYISLLSTGMSTEWSWRENLTQIIWYMVIWGWSILEQFTLLI